jgi:hypothetical protein
VADIVGRARGGRVEHARRDAVSIGLRLGWRQRDLARALGGRSSATMTMIAAAAHREDTVPGVAAQRERMLALLAAPAPPQAGGDPTPPPEPPPAAGDARQDRLHELVELFTVVVTRIDARLTALDAAVGRLGSAVSSLRLQAAPALALGGAAPVQREPDGELLAAAAAAAPAPVPPLAAAPLALPPDVLIEGEMTATRAARLLRSRDYAPVVETAPDAWTVGSKRMSTAEMVAMAEALRRRLLSQRRAA